MCPSSSGFARPVIAFADDDPAPAVFRSMRHAAGHMEFVDVEAGGWVSLWTVDGDVIAIDLRADDFDLRFTGERDVEGLRDRMLLAGTRCGTGHPWDDPIAYVNEAFRRRYEHRLIKWPRWLSRRLHGESPVPIRPASG